MDAKTYFKLGNKGFEAPYVAVTERSTVAEANATQHRRKTMPRGKHYVVFLGRAPRIYDSWSECQGQVIGFPGNSYQSYPTRAEAEEAFQAFRRAQEAIGVTGVEQEPERGNLSGALKGRVEEATTSDDKLKEAANLALIIGCFVLVCAVLIKILA
ncbi:hypothetical protein WN944_003470 [Citrus x changshan-huyou]|uniref:Ribonuclease H1 N-terminal domain-containing protein n=1 Tax=Citrus x changshan-huyou TaxID=2935761 RepID=A0AAP0QFG5_9ROSI